MAKSIKEILEQLGVEVNADNKVESTDCPASDEAHDIVEWLLDKAELAKVLYDDCIERQDELGAHEVRLNAIAMREIALAIHDGVHTDYIIGKRDAGA